MKTLVKIIFLILSLGLVVSCAKSIKNGSSFLDDLFNNNITIDNGSSKINDFNNDLDSNMILYNTYEPLGNYHHSINIFNGYDELNDNGSSINSTNVRFSFEIYTENNFEIDTYEKLLAFANSCIDDENDCIAFPVDSGCYSKNWTGIDKLIFYQDNFYVLDSEDIILFKINNFNLRIGKYNYYFNIDDSVEEEIIYVPTETLYHHEITINESQYGYLSNSTTLDNSSPLFECGDFRIDSFSIADGYVYIDVWAKNRTGNYVNHMDFNSCVIEVNGNIYTYSLICNTNYYTNREQYKIDCITLYGNNFQLLSIGSFNLTNYNINFESYILSSESTLSFTFSFDSNSDAQILSYSSLKNYCLNIYSDNDIVFNGVGTNYTDNYDENYCGTIESSLDSIKFDGLDFKFHFSNGGYCLFYGENSTNVFESYDIYNYYILVKLYSMTDTVSPVNS